MEPIIINSIPIAINKPHDSFYNQYHTFDRTEQNTPEDDNFNNLNPSPTTSFSQSAPDRIENYILTNPERNNPNIITIPNWNNIFPSPTITVDSIRRYDKRCYVSPLDKFRLNTVSRDNNNAIFCPICQDSKNSLECKITICNHHFCTGCIKSWLIDYKHDNCPVCNKNLKV